MCTNQLSQLLVFDLDGTLLDSQHRIPAGVRAQLVELRNVGVETTLATGRPYAAVQQFAQELEITLPLIVFNGAAIMSPDGRPICTRPLPLASAREVLELLSDTTAANQLYLEPSDDEFYTDKQGPASDYITEKDGLACRVVESLFDVLEQADKDPVKMFSIGSRSELELVQRELQASGLSVSCVFSEHDMLEFLGPSVNKGTALDHLCETIGLAPESVWAFGDNMNDLEMLKVAGTGVSMTSAPDALKHVADWVSDDLDSFIKNHFSEQLARRIND